MQDGYIRFSNPNLNGESGDKDHAGFAEITHYEEGITQPRSATASTAGGHSSERATFDDVLFTKELDVLSPLLRQHAAGGTTFDEVTVELMRADGQGNRVKYYEVIMKHVMISRISMVYTGGVPSEQITLKFAAIKWKYTQQKIGGGEGGVTQGAWSLTKNDKTYGV